jgi:E3 ubiquitin-protein ligase HUWE1
VLEVKDLVPNGSQISVTEENKFEYVQKLCYAKLYEEIKPQMEALLEGIYEIIPLNLISIFNNRELELIISGLPTVDSKCSVFKIFS